MDELIAPLKARYCAGEAVQLIDNETRAIRIVDFAHDETRNLLILLLQYSDARAPDPAFSPLNSGVVRVEPKRDGEGIATSAHVTISLAEPDADLSYFMMLEKVTGLSRTRVERFLRKQFSEISLDHFYYEDERGIAKGCRPLVDLRGYPSDQLMYAIESGELQGFELVERREENEQLDEDTYIEETVKTIKVAIGTPSPNRSKWDIVQSVFRRGRELNAETMRIRYRNSETSKMQNVVVDLGDNIENTMFIRESSIRLERDTACETAIRHDIIERMFCLFPHVE